MVIVVFVVGTIFLTKTRGGIRFLAAGGNAEALRRAGVNANTYRLLGFILSGALAALGGVVQDVGRLGHLDHEGRLAFG